ncbi:glycine betaine uptake BCCT transporter [Pseudalkalibacillus salsuginis]|uniref:glycine betaine uptake BCCT transporter n=1 Tax=Pseudalkalibacillus salsuginis TaxID=2910972 RepID=UPI001F2B8223|nr:BCCT family transporter [Pseudalkalibacillus salsuginis]MCF6412050.1 BCCT family transporter [Pseudalkalibacillus salsuginis]
MKKFTKVFIISLVISVIFIAWGVLYPKGLQQATGSIQNFLQVKFGWFYLLSATGFLIFSIYLIFSKYGKIKLGKDDDKPDYSLVTWFAMLFSAGMGIGLVFWGVAEPLFHYYDPPSGNGETVESANASLRYAMFHWGLHPWGIYTVVGLALAYFKFRKGAPGLISAIFRPLLGDRVNGPIGILIDVIAVFATVFGVATSLGFGAAQISGGISYLFEGVANNQVTQLIIIAIVTVLFILSASTGLNKGIKYLSNINIVLALGLMFFLLFAGPTNFIMDVFTQTLGSYVQNLPTMSFRLGPYSETTQDWTQAWTVFYWAWWIAWAPFVGMFIARVSKGRTIREFVLGVLLVPTIFSALWFSVFGGSAVFMDRMEGTGLYSIMTDNGTEIALFALFEQVPLGGIMSIIAILLISTFFITSADSATFVLGMQTTNGSLNPSNYIKFIWGGVVAASAAILLYSGGLQALQTASIIAAFPFTFIMIAIVFATVKALKEDYNLNFKNK